MTEEHGQDVRGTKHDLRHHLGGRKIAANGDAEAAAAVCESDGDWALSLQRRRDLLALLRRHHQHLPDRRFEDCWRRIRSRCMRRRWSMRVCWRIWIVR